VDQGQIVTLLGANGAGKSSTIRALNGLVRCQGSTIEVGVRRFDNLRPDQRVKGGMATVPEGRDLFKSLTVEQNLRMGAYRRRRDRAVHADLEWIYETFPALSQSRSDRASNLSGGQAQMLAIGRALMTAPQVLLLDEPSHGLAPHLVAEVFRLLPRLRDERNLAILLVEQNAGMALSTASYGYVLEAGVLRLEGSTKDLIHDPRVRQLYLGG
jgi:branched-chain amino acid transport system ATP-binding protein